MYLPVARLLNTEGYLQNNYKKQTGKMSYVVVSVSPKGHQFLTQAARNPTIELKISPPQDMKKLMKFKSTADDPVTYPNIKDVNGSQVAPKVTIIEDPEEKRYRNELYKMLIAKRNEFAIKLDHMPYLIASNTALNQLSKFRPTTIAEIKSNAIDGFNVGKIEKFGESFLALIKEYIAANPDPKTSVSKKRIKQTDKPVATTSNCTLELCIPKTINAPNKDTNTTTSSTNGLNVLKRFAFVQRDHIPELKTAEIANETKQDTSYSWLNSPEHDNKGLVPTGSQDVFDDTFMDNDSFDTDLMNVVDNIEKKIKESPIKNVNVVMKETGNVAEKETTLNIENDNGTRGIKKKANSSFSEWWTKKKMTKFDSFLDE